MKKIVVSTVVTLLSLTMFAQSAKKNVITKSVNSMVVTKAKSKKMKDVSVWVEPSANSISGSVVHMELPKGWEVLLMTVEDQRFADSLFRAIEIKDSISAAKLKITKKHKKS